MKQNIFKIAITILLLGLFLSSNLFSQSPLVVNGSEISYYYHKTTDENGTVYGTMVGGAYSIGMLTNIGGHDWEKYRSTYQFNISSLPTDATVTAVKLSYSVSSAGGNYDDFTVTDYQVTGSSSYYQRWTGVGSATTIFNNLSGSSGSNKTSSILTNRVNNSRTLNWFTLGTFSNDESTDNSNAITSITVTIEYTTTPTTLDLTAKNDMAGYNGGNIGVGVNTSATSELSPYPINDVNVGDNINLQAYENQTNGGYNFIWNDTEAPLEKSKWEKKIGTTTYPAFSTSQSASYTVASGDNGANLVANLKKVCNLTFTNSFNGISTTGSIKINGSTVSAPTTQYSVVEGNIITVEALPYEESDIQYTFSHWSDDNSTTNPRTMTASTHANITAVFVGTPIFTNNADNNRDLHFNTYSWRTQSFVKLYWDEHISSNVTKYSIWRGVDNNPAVQIAIVNRGTTTYTDDDYFIEPWHSNNSLIHYDVRAYYLPDQTYSAHDYEAVYGSLNQVNKSANSDSLALELPIIKDFALNSNYPNPFNPTTQISYEIPENSFVNLVVYNSIGQKVVELVNQHQTMGKYSVQFDASNPDGSGRGLTSGVYIYKLQAGEFSDVKKMLLMK